MKAPSKGTGYTLEEYGRVLVKSGPSPDHPYVWCAVGHENGKDVYESIHIEEFKEKRIH